MGWQKIFYSENKVQCLNCQFIWLVNFFTYFNDVCRAQDIGGESILHVLGSGGLQIVSVQDPCVVNQQVETPCPH